FTYMLINSVKVPPRSDDGSLRRATKRRPSSPGSGGSVHDHRVAAEIAERVDADAIRVVDRRLEAIDVRLEHAVGPVDRDPRPLSGDRLATEFNDELIELRVEQHLQRELERDLGLK